MTVSPEKIVPRAIALAFVGFCVWPSLAELVKRPDVSPPPKKQEKIAAKPAPKPPAATRDPFLDPVAMALAAEKKAIEDARAAGKGPGKPGVAGQTGDSPPSNVVVDPLAGLVLEATSIVGNQRLAVINGKLYAPKDMLATDLAGGIKRRVVEVQPYKVVLDCDGKLKELTYTSVPARREQTNKTTANQKDNNNAGGAETSKSATTKTSGKTKSSEEKTKPTP
jgi:hypothetical protein